MHADQEAVKLVTPELSVWYGAQTFTTINETANVNLNGTVVNGAVVVNGDFNATNARIDSLLVNGNALLTNCTVSGTVSVYGGIQMTNSQVNGTISTYAQNIILDNCKVSSISLKNNPTPQMVQIRFGTLVSGGITFDSGVGTVLLFKGCFITGPIVGARLQLK